MATVITTRIFKFNNQGQVVVLTDPNPDFTEDEVLNFYTTAYPALTTATITQPQLSEDGSICYEFVSTVGTKG